MDGGREREGGREGEGERGRERESSYGTCYVAAQSSTLDMSLHGHIYLVQELNQHSTTPLIFCCLVLFNQHLVLYEMDSCHLK